MKKENKFSCLFDKDIISNGLIQAKKTTELVLLFHKKTTELVFPWPNMGQKCFKVLINMSLIRGIIQIHCTRNTNLQIFKILKAPKSTVRDALN